MSQHVAETEFGSEVEHAHPGPGQYILIGVILAVITVLEVHAYTRTDIKQFLVPLLLVLSAIKFLLVISFYMHLRFDDVLYRFVFGFGLAVAGSVITALLFLFSQYPKPPIVPGS
jgi:cytochrome c oxidase subunit IV